MTQVLESAPSQLLEDVQHFVFEDASWELYEQLLKSIGDRPIRMTYDSGRLKIMSPLLEHENPKRMIGRMVEMLTLERSIPLFSCGSTTYKIKSGHKGLEPDECYYIQNAQKMQGRKPIDLLKDPPPDLAIEIDITSRSIARQPIYAAMGLPEIWRWDGHTLECLHLAGQKYKSKTNSRAFPFLQPADLRQFIGLAGNQGENAAVKAFVKWVKLE